MSNEIIEQSKIDFVERELSQKRAFGYRFSDDLIKPFIKKWEGILYYERNRTPEHPQFTEFRNRVSDSFDNPLGHIGKEAAIKYYVFSWHKVIPQVIFEQYEVIVKFRP